MPPRSLTPWAVVVVAIAAWINREQEKVIDYLKAENNVLTEQLKGRGRLRFTDGQRCLLAAKAKALGRAALKKLETLVSPDTLLRWHRQLIAKKYDGSAKRGVGRPGTIRNIEALVIKIATENPTWGYLRITGALANLGHVVARTTIANVLERHGLSPAPDRKTTWRQFLCAHWDVLAATDFLTVEVWRPFGLARYHVLFVIELATRRIHIAGIIADPHGAWMHQVARNLTDAFDGFLLGKRYLIQDRDPLFTHAFRATLKVAGVKSARLPSRSPNLNAFAERFVLSIKSECLNKLIFFSEAQLHRAVTEYVAHYHEERNHQGLANRLVVRPGAAANSNGEVRLRQRLGGMLSYYHRQAA